jgi:glutaminyl-peptide cyclotransferase
MMRSLLLPMLLAAGGCQRGRSDITFDGPQALEWVRHQVSAGARVPNTPAHRSTGDWLEQQLRQRADSVEVQAFTHVTAAGDTLHLRNFIARFRPADPSRVLYLAHWDSRPMADSDPVPGNRRLPVPGANDGASGVAVLLGVADQLKRAPPSTGVDLLFTDGEDYGADFSGPDVLLGAKYFAARVPAGYRPLFAILFDMVGDADQQFKREQYSREAAPEIVDRVWRTAADLGLRRVFQDQDAGYVTDDHVPLIRAGIRTVDIIDFDYPHHHTIADTIDKVSARSLENVGRVAMALLR